MVRFLRKQLEDVPWEHGKRYAEARITKLAELANGLFIWARVVCSLLQKRLSHFSPDNVLDSILDSQRTLGDSEQIAMLYHQVIMLLFPDSEGQQLFQEYLTATLALQESLPIDEFSAFTNLPTRVIEGIQAELKAFQIRKLGGAKDEGAQVHPARSLFHLSFLEYLEWASTPAHMAFHVSLFDSHSRLAEFCLAELPRFLPSPRPLSPLDLYSRRRYAITYLMVHIHHGSPSAQPGSAEEWEHSTHCTTLRQCDSELLQRWADLVVDLVGGAPTIEEYTGGGRDISEDIGEVDAVDSSDTHGDHDEKRAKSGSEDPELADNNEFMARNVDHDATDGGKAPKADVNHDTWVAQLLHGVATTFGEEYTSRSAFRMSCLEVAVRVRPHDAGYWYDLGWAYHFVAQWSGSVKAHDWAVIALQNALWGVDNPTQHDPGRFPYALATALHKRFWAFGRPEDLDQSIALHRDALSRRPPGHPQRGLSLNNLARSIGTYVMERGSRKGEIDKMISLQREALDFLPQGHEDTSMYLYNLAAKLRCRYEMKASMVDLEEAIRLGREAVALCPSGHPARASALNELAWDLTIKYKAQDNSGSLEEAICVSRESLSLCPIGNPERPNILDTLATALHFVQDHLTEALQLSRESLSLIPLNHSYRWEVMSIVAAILLSHYERSGLAEDLEEATSVCEQALTLCPPNHIRRPRLLALQAKLVEATSSTSSFKS
jgi:tetratricopeptide (TPR) repeat protein